MKKIIVVIGLAVLALLSSCAVAEIEREVVSPQSEVIGTKVKSSNECMTRRDSLKLLYKYQTDARTLLGSYIVKKNGEYKICISKENALDLGIDAELYDRFEDYTEKMNKR